MEEYLDVLDSKGNPIGQKKLRSEVHRDEDWHRLAFVWIMNSRGELLIQKRSMEKDTNAGRWDASCGGHVIAGETSSATAIKELQEELGITVLGNQLEYLFSTREQLESNREKQFVGVFLLLADIPVPQLKLQKEEVDEVRYLPWRDVENLTLKKDNTFAPRYNQYKKLFELLRNKFGNV